MTEVKGDLWSYVAGPGGFRCITTNGVVRKDGHAVMGRGCARQAKDRWPNVSLALGHLIKDKGNHVHYLGQFSVGGLISFPVKHHWEDRADLDLIRRSCYELREILMPSKTYLLPRPGCGNGQRDWESEVRPVLHGILPDNVLVITK